MWKRGKAWPRTQRWVCGPHFIEEIASLGIRPSNNGEGSIDALVGKRSFLSVFFRTTAMPIELDRTLIPPLLRKAKGILEMENPPEGQEGCKECQMVYEMARISGKP